MIRSNSFYNPQSKINFKNNKVKELILAKELRKEAREISEKSGDLMERADALVEEAEELRNEIKKENMIKLTTTQNSFEK